MNLFNIPLQMSLLATPKYDTLYWAIDIHSTILVPTYDKGLSNEFYPDSIEVLKFLTSKPEHKLILWTCSHPHEIDQYIELFKTHNIEFDFVNENPEATNTKFGCFDKKFYANIVLDDKAGFEGNVDWHFIKQELDKYY